jgi:signal transduction histidine kinase
MTDRVVPDRVPRLSPWATDVLLAGVTALTAISNVFVAGEPDARPPDVLAYGLAAALGGILLLRRRWPRAVLIGSVALLQSYLILGYPAIGMALLAVALYTVAVRGRLAWGVTVGVALLAGEVGWRVLFDPEPPLEVLVSGWAPGTIIAAVLLLGDTVRSRRALAAETAERLSVAEREREHQVERRVAEERLRISRELHDVVAHTVTGIGVQARVVADSIDEHPDHARAALAAIQTAISEAMSQLRATVGLLRRHEHEPFAPVPSLAGLDRLVEMASGDVAVTTRIDGERRRLPPTVDLTAYRIIQESLTNVVRHANAVEATVTLHYLSEMLVIEVVDDGDGPRGALTRGHGLTGMAERAQAVGGDLVAEPGARGGFRVAARLPIGAAS